MTIETDAIKMWCPFARVLLAGFQSQLETGRDAHNTNMPDPVCNRLCDMIEDASSHGAFGEENNCIGSRCMSWRWIGKPEDGDLRQGYCGLAGHPCPAFIVNGN